MGHTRRRRLLAAAALLVLASGSAVTARVGTSGTSAPSYLRGHHDLPRAVGAPPRAPSYDVPVLSSGRRAGTAHVSRTGFSTWEPTLGLAGGDVFVQVSGPGNKTSVARSLDSGRTWDLVAPSVGGTHPHQVSLDPYLHVDGSGDEQRLYLADAVGGCSLLTYSRDGGDSWEQTGLACGPGPNDHQNVFTGAPVISPSALADRVVYYCYNAIVASECARSVDGGASFLPPGGPVFFVADPAAGGGNATLGVEHFCFTPSIGHGTTAADGTVFVPRGHCGQPWLAISRDEGLTWTRSQVASNGVATIHKDPSHEASVAVSDDGTVFYGWLAEDRQPYVATSADGGLTWSEPVRVGVPRLVQTRLAAMAVAGDGTVVMAFYGSTNAPAMPVQGEDDPIDGYGSAQHYANSTWNGYIATGDPRAKRVQWRVTQVNPSSDPLVRGACGTNRCAQVGDFIDVQVAGRTAWVAFVDVCVAKCARTAKAANDGGEALVVRVPLGAARKPARG